MKTKKVVFVIMPISSTQSCTETEWTEIYENVFKSAIEACGYTCERAIPQTGSLIGTIVERLRNTRIVLADITDQNPNVFYELGVRHSLSRGTIIACQDTVVVPSDLRGYWTLQYGIRPAQVAKFSKDLRRLTFEIESDPDRSDSPVSDYLDRENIGVAGYMQRENIKKLAALYTELSGNLIAVARLEGCSYHSTEYIGQYSLISTECLNLLLATLYVDLGPDLLKKAYELMFRLRALRIPSKRDLLEDTISGIKSFAEKVYSIREKLLSGEYEEPRELSTMIWTPSAEGADRYDSGFPGNCKRSDTPLANPNIDLPENWLGGEARVPQECVVHPRKTTLKKEQ